MTLSHPKTNLSSLRKMLVLCTGFCFASSVFSIENETDSVKPMRTKKLQEVTVTGTAQQQSRQATPLQVMSDEDFSRISASSVSDAVKHFSGVNVKDYGGIGGLKTVSVRSLGAQHTGVSYDGVMLNDVQTGQIDLGKFSLDNVEKISLNNGQPDDIFQTARMFASSGIIAITTKTPDFNTINQLKGKAAIKSGTLGLFNPSLFLSKNISRKFILSANGEWMKANGRFRFTQTLGPGYDTVRYRNNSDVDIFHGELNGNYQTRENENLSAKVYYYDSERGLPGAVIYYADNNKERLWDKQFFGQLHYLNKISQHWQYQASGKFNRYVNRYIDFSNKYAGGKQENHYLQREYYGSGTVQYRPISGFSLSLANDYWYNNLNIDYFGFVYPKRHSLLSALAAKYITDRWNVTASLLNTFTHETVSTGNAAPDRERLSPAIAGSWKIFSDKEWRLRAFYKDVFRVPTFNDLYYARMGNPDLKPEKTQQYNIGIICSENPFSFLSESVFSIDAYYNQVKDKIIAVPQQNLYVWTMTNLGKVQIIGTDVNIKTVAEISSCFRLNINGNYTFQSAHDITPGNATYGNQIRYTPYHSGSANVSLKHAKYEVGYSACFSGRKWYSDQNLSSTRMNSFADQNIFASGNFRLKGIELNLTGELLNLMDKQYEIVRNYPMPGRQFRISLNAKF